jgi:hypothetical protein
MLMILPKLACGLAVMRLGGVAAVGFAGLAGLGQALGDVIAGLRARE